MISLVISEFIDLFVAIFNILLLTRVVMTYFVKPGNRLFSGLVNITEPLLAPVRSVLPKTPGIDFAPLATFLILQALRYVIHGILGV
jgi:YggT family protein